MIINHSSIIELNREALANNLKFIRSLIKEKTQLSSVIKGNAYGHGIKQMVPELERLGVNHFSVFSSFEAKIAYQYTEKNSTIMIMGDITVEDKKWVVRNEIEFFVYNIKTFQSLLAEAKKLNKKLNIHVELETGMNRHGFDEEELNHLFKLLHENKNHFNLKGICTHFAGAESSTNYKRIQEQHQRFSKSVERFSKEGFKAEKLHTSCSAGIMAYPEFNYDMVRIGIITYGLWPSKEIQLMYNVQKKTELDLQSVLSWRSSIIDIKKCKSGRICRLRNFFSC
ncbi:alanine racemase [Mesonia maritima]|uniref:alanine racemase n=1 Tax=Mesonia maritima TaxID=1793873 RepID=UPI00363990F3